MIFGRLVVLTLLFALARKTTTENAWRGYTQFDPSRKWKKGLKNLHYINAWHDLYLGGGRKAFLCDPGSEFDLDRKNQLHRGESSQRG